MRAHQPLAGLEARADRLRHWLLTAALPLWSEAGLDREGGGFQELLGQDGRPSPAPRRVRVQARQAYSLHRWGQRTGDAWALLAAEQLRSAGRNGIDPAREVAVDEMGTRQGTRSETARFWPQTEWLKASLHLGEQIGDWRAAEQACDAVLRFLATPTSGLWWDRMLAGGEMRVEPAPASTFYHVVTACAEVFRVAGDRPAGAVAGISRSLMLAGAADRFGRGTKAQLRHCGSVAATL